MRTIAKRVLPQAAQRQIGSGLRFVRRARQRLRRADFTLGPRDRVVNKQVTNQSRALWMGFAEDARAGLEAVRRSGTTADKPIARAAETLARWYATHGQLELSLDRVIHARVLNGKHHSERLLVLEHHLLTELGLFDGANRIFEVHGGQSANLHLMQANLLLRRAEMGEILPEEADRERLELIDWAFRRQSLVPISELVQDELSFGALGSKPARETSAGTPVISIVVPAYNAEATLATSVNSMRAQTLTDIQIIIVDDASTDNTYAVAAELASQDPRIKVIRHSENQGAYGARNTGLMNADGEYTTVHDADDWSHPQLLERQLTPLQAKRGTGSFSRLARVTPAMKFLLRPYRPMLEPIHWNYTSLLVRTETLRQFGGWDMVRAHADSELIERLREYFGSDALVEVETQVPLSFFSVSGNNLTESSDTALRSVDFGSRKEYTEQARFWRALTFAEGEIPSYNEHRRISAKSPFFCARSLTTNRSQISQDYDLVIGSDLALKGGTRRCNLAYIECAQRIGLRVGIFNMPRYMLRGAGSIDPTYRELFQIDGVDLLTPEDNVSAKTLLVHHPPVLRKKFDGYPGVKADRHYVLVNQLPWEMKDRSSVQYDTGTIRRHYVDAFGGEATWIPISPRVRRYLSSELPAELLYDEDWYPIVNWELSPLSGPAGSLNARPIVGRHSRDHWTKWPEMPQTLEQCYLAGTEYEVQLLGGVSGAEAVLGYRPRNWVVHPFDSISVEDYLTKIDIFVHYHHSQYIEEFGRNIAEAMAKGIVCILPPEYEETFFDAALYARPGDLVAVIEGVWADRDRYYEYSNRGIAYVKENCGLETGMARIESLLR
jgi:glycosyltransferase involved in cell wall biosynthesis